MIINLIGFLGGFLVSSIIDSTLGEFGEWAVVGAGLVTAAVETLSSLYYTLLRKTNKIRTREYAFLNLLRVVQYFKAGIIYGLIVDAFKLGS